MTILTIITGPSEREELNVVTVATGAETQPGWVDRVLRGSCSLLQTVSLVLVLISRSQPSLSCGVGGGRLVLLNIFRKVRILSGGEGYFIALRCLGGRANDDLGDPKA